MNGQNQVDVRIDFTVCFCTILAPKVAIHTPDLVGLAISRN